MNPDELTKHDLGHFQHELLNRIAVISVYAALLKDEKLSADHREMVNEIAIAASRAQELTMGLDIHAS